jgi:hypothetical protein
VVGLHVEVPVSAEVERNDLRLAGLPRTDRLVDHGPDGVVRLDPREVMLAAARSRDLTFAQRAGLGTALIPRPTELGAGQTQDMTPKAIGTSSVRASSISAVGSPMHETTHACRRPSMHELPI